VLGTLRARISRRLALAGVQMKWQVDDLPPMPHLGPRAVLDIARVVQEAITNAIKHSGCGEITVRAALAADGRHVEICVADNGRGVQQPGKGRGLSGMQRRASELGGSVTLESSPAGTRVTLALPAAASRIDAPGQAPIQAQPAKPPLAHS
jgi:signal transduction histidine kinase